ncbi:MAG: hypothetical protein Q9184_001122 [Pyrenodesmia sp. 2 TL-2023]
MPPLQPALSLVQPAARSLRLRLTGAEKDTTTKDSRGKSAKVEKDAAIKRQRARLTEAEKNQKHNESEAKRRQTIQQIVRGQIGPHLGMMSPKNCRNEGNVWKAYREHALQLLEVREELIGELKAVGVDVEKDLGIFTEECVCPETNRLYRGPLVNPPTEARARKRATGRNTADAVLEGVLDSAPKRQRR